MKKNKAIKSGLEDVKAGRVTSNQDFQKEPDEWLAMKSSNHPYTLF